MSNTAESAAGFSSEHVCGAGVTQCAVHVVLLCQNEGSSSPASWVVVVVLVGRRGDGGRGGAQGRSENYGKTHHSRLRSRHAQ